MSTINIYIERLKINLDPDVEQSPLIDLELHEAIAKHCRVDVEDVIDYTITHRSLDSRRKGELKLIYRIIATLPKKSLSEEALQHFSAKIPEQEHGLDDLAICADAPMHPIIVGTGPSGIMAAYLFAQHGRKPIILDRGFDVDKRGRDISEFHESKILNPDSNYLNGEGGAGTYSDGKLYTRIKNPRIKYVLEAFVKAGAPEEILYLNHPHIGSDILVPMMRKIRKQIEDWGGEFRWGTKVTDIIVENDKCQGVILESGEELRSQSTLFAIGHSARSLIKKLVDHGIDHNLKDFQIGSRIEHPQAFINKMQYGMKTPPICLKSAEYNLVSRPPAQTHAATATSFCMCPGGEIIAATSHDGQLSTNGMSRYLRNQTFANSALIVNQLSENYANAAEAFAFIDKVEKKIFKAGGGDFVAPAQSAEGFVRGEIHTNRSQTSYDFGIKPARVDFLFPKRTTRALREALKYFDKRSPGFIETGMFIGGETRVSSPVRFTRQPESLASSINNLYIVGEGAGYASGITSAAIDGMRITEALLTGKPYEK